MGKYFYDEVEELATQIHSCFHKDSRGLGSRLMAKLLGFLADFRELDFQVQSKRDYGLVTIARFVNYHQAKDFATRNISDINTELSVRDVRNNKPLGKAFAHAGGVVYQPTIHAP